MTCLNVHELPISGKQYECTRCNSKWIVEYAGKTQWVRFYGDLIDNKVIDATCKDAGESRLLHHLEDPLYSLFHNEIFSPMEEGYHLRGQAICEDCYQQMNFLDAGHTKACTQLIGLISKARDDVYLQKTARIASAADMVMEAVAAFSKKDLQKLLRDIGVDKLLGYELFLSTDDKLPVKSGLWSRNCLEAYVSQQVDDALGVVGDKLEVPSKEILEFVSQHHIGDRVDVLVPVETWQQEYRDGISGGKYAFTLKHNQPHRPVYKMTTIDLSSALEPLRIDHTEVMLALRKHKPVAACKTIARKWFAFENKRPARASRIIQSEISRERPST